jgi:hypothetical protein
MKFFKPAAVSVAAAALATSALMAADTSEETRDVDSFSRVQLSGSMDVEVRVGSAQSVRVVADSDVIDDLMTRVKGDTLKIYLDRNFHGRIEKMKVYVTVPSLEGVGVHGSGDMLVEDAEGDDFEVEVHGSGDATLKNTKVKDLSIDVHGSGDVKIDGTCEDVDVDVHGSGDVMASRMECASGKVSVQGSGDVDIYADGSADVRVQGSGDVSVYGKPDKINSRVHGSGDIRVR